ncbi:MAG TPA: diaminopimelate decarboxylase [Dehalococcoidia bacterium]|nr:diaminopimelate decarboxylase [Dehalococcoidia bacterium]
MSPSASPLISRTRIFPETTDINDQNHLVIGGCDIVDLAAQFGTPLYLFDEATLRGQCAAYREAFRRRYQKSQVVYASKAYINRALAQLFQQEGLGLDVVSAGELAIADSVGFPLDRVYFHGNNKGPDELRFALERGLGTVVVDNFHELETFDRIAGELGTTATIMLRVSPGVDPHTHHHTTTGILDSKFGFPIQTDAAEEAVIRGLKAPHLNLTGLHIHLGSPIFELEPFQQGIAVTLDFARKMQDRHGLQLEQFSPGGGFAIQYLSDAPAPTIEDYADAIVSTLLEELGRHHLPEPLLILEPGRSIVGRAGVAVYSVGSSKTIPNVRKYVSVDGGMADNIRPAIYGSQYEAVVANRVEADRRETVTIAGKYCESGDILIRDIALPVLSPGDLIAIPASGAYCLSMASNYNAALRPPIALVANGRSRLIRRRETFEDLMRTDLPLEA